jgi:ATP-dependent Lhr-like helicase
VVVDELHAFAGDDRGWHLLAVLERVTRIAGRELQRVGLSATIGNPEALLAWLKGSATGAARVIQATAESLAAPDLAVDFVGPLQNAVVVIAQLYRGEKRLVFLDSRARVEELAAGLREAGVTTFVSHSSLGLDERRRAEAAFAEASDCVIVATSTLELGLDVGDLDRVIQVDAPFTVSGFLQRLGRTGRRPGSRRNCLFLATSDDALLRACGLVQLWSEGYVEPVTPPPEPFHVLAQQWLALALQQGGIGRSERAAWLGQVPAFAAMAAADLAAIETHMVERGILTDDHGILSIGPEGERLFGRRNYMELFSVFTSPPLFTVFHGRAELGQVHQASFEIRHEDRPVLLLGGRSWRVTHIDWDRRVAYAEPTELRGRSRWLGEGGVLHFDLTRAMRRVLVRQACPAALSRRASDRLARICGEFPWVDVSGTALVRDGEGQVAWWTFAGLRANAVLAGALGDLARGGRDPDNFALHLRPDATLAEVRERLRFADAEKLGALVPVSRQALANVKFAPCLSEWLVERMVRSRVADARGARLVLSEALRSVTMAA